MLASAARCYCSSQLYALSGGYCGQLGMAKVRNSRHRTERRCSNIDFRGGQGRNRGGTPGRHLFTKDYRANLTIKSFPNPDNDSPAVFLEKMRPPADIQYRRVTPKFFAISSVRNGHTWYNRCNRANGFMNCVLINYPAVEERQWDAVVTRISLSLAK